MTDIVNKFLKDIVRDDGDKEMCLELFFKALPRKSHYERYCDGMADCSLHRSPIYEWWDEWCNENITNKAFCKIVQEALYDEDIYAFISNIHDKYADDIDYDEICNKCGEESYGVYGADSDDEGGEALCKKHKEEGGYCSCGWMKAECEDCKNEK